jgi:hypothetical protein
LIRVLRSLLRGGCALCAIYVLLVGFVFLVAAGPFEENRSALVWGVVLLIVGVVGVRWALRGASRRTLVLIGALAVFVLGPCTVFFESYNALPPFEITDASGAQWQIQREVPGEVRYTTGYGVAVSPPRIDPAPSSGRNVWVIPVRFSNDRESDKGHVGRCALLVDGNLRDPHSERPEIRALGDVDGQVVSFPAGGGYEGRVAFEVPANATRVRLYCTAHAYVAANFDLTAFLSRR